VDALTGRTAWGSKLLIVALTLAAFTGWGLYVHATQQIGHRLQEAQARAAQLETERDALIGERDQLRARSEAATRGEGELKLAREELRTLRVERDSLSADLERARAARSSPATEPEAAGTTASAGQHSVAAVQRALVGAGFGPLQLDGALGPKTRDAIRSFERAQGLPVTGEVNTRVVEALEKASGQPLQ
jgi:hypothetical protein